MNVTWVDVRTLIANEYNPNIVLSQEMKLLQLSLMLTGWVQPLLVHTSLKIIDGFHRHYLSKTDEQLIERYNFHVPVCLLDLSEPDRMLLTIRINRAKGQHQAYKMHQVIDQLINEHHYSKEEVARQIGAGLDEIDLLLQENVFTKQGISKHEYSKAWVPN